MGERHSGGAVRSDDHSSQAPTTGDCGVTITLPVHPFFGQTLVLVKTVRFRRDKRRYFDVEHPVAGRLRLPEEWTDRGVRLSGTTVLARADSTDLLSLATTVRTLLVGEGFLDEEVNRINDERHGI